MSDRKFINRVRLRLASWIFGGDWYGVVMRLWLIRERAMAAVNADGRVTLAECESLAEALYAPIPGEWTLTVTRAAVLPEERAHG